MKKNGFGFRLVEIVLTSYSKNKIDISYLGMANIIEKEEDMKRDKIACNCENVTYGQIIDAVNNGAKTFEEVSEITGCSTGCGGCREFIEVFVRDLVMFPEENA